ncbi:phenylalanine ammonia-lyase [Xylogone sp. PMI_703]|nr:phenylalanine ammonia-lyase [Xylogone sp. PMI_703]
MMAKIATKSPHLTRAYDCWMHLQKRKGAVNFELDGNSLHIADVVSVAYHDCIPRLTSRQDVTQGLHDSVQVLMDHLAKDYYVYGVNTGFGGSADSRTEEVVKLQAALMQLTQAGILTPSPGSTVPEQAMPAAWVRATIVVRCNATMRGHSAVSLPVLQAMVGLLEHRLAPVVPLRGSVSASGDLMPLSYIAGAIEGNPDILVESNAGGVLPAPQALQAAGLSTVQLGPKEGLGLVNGTASSAAVGALVMSKAQNLALLTQALTALAVEALHGSSESFAPFMAQVRPHPGQVESARNISFFLGNSYLARDVRKPKDRRREDMVQDRYSLRSAPQWIGPQLEDLLLADQQISVELNSSCDNPLVDVDTQDILYGCNFQAASVTSAMEKTRLSMQMFGRLLLAQLTEMVDPTLSGGLPASLAADDPSLSFTMKGVEISMAAYMAELSYLANPMSLHVQAAEMHNQSVNSMALASARMSMQAVEVLTMMCACSLYAGCQALDLRALHLLFKRKAVKAISSVTASSFTPGLKPEELDSLQRALEVHFAASWDTTGKLDLHHRCQKLVESALPFILEKVNDNVPIPCILEWENRAAEAAFDVWNKTFNEFCLEQHTAELLGNGSSVLYRFVRKELGIPFHQGFVEHPTATNTQLGGRCKKTIGGWISIIYGALQNGVLYSSLMTLVVRPLLNEAMGP